MEKIKPHGLSGSALKWIAVVTMSIDHFAAVILLGRLYSERAWGSGLWSRQCYWDLRIIGRFAFPIYCFLICEGYRHTRSLRAYLLRMLGFALLSELPFDLAFQRNWFDLSAQNVFFTLAFGLSAIALWETLRREKEGRALAYSTLAAVLVCAALCVAAELMNTDYGGMGVLLTLAMWLLRRQPAWRILAAAAIFASMAQFFHSSWVELYALAAFIPIGLYNGERGKQLKYMFYIFYPVHLLLFAGITKLLF